MGFSFMGFVVFGPSVRQFYTIPRLVRARVRVRVRVSVRIRVNFRVRWYMTDSVINSSLGSAHLIDSLPNVIAESGERRVSLA